MHVFFIQLFEALIKKKPIFFPDYIKCDNEEYVIKNYNCLNLLKTKEELFTIIQSIYEDRTLLKSYIQNNDKYLQNIIDIYLPKENFIMKYNKFYDKLLLN